MASSTPSSGTVEPVAVPDERLEPAGEDADHRVARALVGEPHLGEPGLLLGELRDAPPERVGERLRTEADREQGHLVGDPAAQELVLVLEPGMLVLLADVLVAAEHEHGVEVTCRLRGGTDLPLDELVTLGRDDVAEDLRPNERPVIDGEHAHGANVPNRSCMLRLVFG